MHNSTKPARPTRANQSATLPQRGTEKTQTFIGLVFSVVSLSLTTVKSSNVMASLWRQQPQRKPRQRRWAMAIRRKSPLCQGLAAKSQSRARCRTYPAIFRLQIQLQLFSMATVLSLRQSQSMTATFRLMLRQLFLLVSLRLSMEQTVQLQMLCGSSQNLLLWMHNLNHVW